MEFPPAAPHFQPLAQDRVPAEAAAGPAWAALARGAIAGAMGFGLSWTAALLWPAPWPGLAALGVLMWAAGGVQERALRRVAGAPVLALVLGAKVLALASLPIALAPMALLAAQPGSRFAAVAVRASIWPAPGAGDEPAPVGAGAMVAGALITLAALSPLVLAVGTWAAFGAAAGLLAGYGVSRRACERRFKGYTRDSLCVTQQVSEAGLYMGLAAAL